MSAFWGLFFGGLNFWFLSRIVTGMVEAAAGQDKSEGLGDASESKSADGPSDEAGNAKKGKSRWKKIALFFVLKMALIFVTIGLILKKGYVTPLPFLAGFTASLIAGIAFKVLRHSTKEKESGNASF